MPAGNFVSQVKNKNAINIADLDEFMITLLKDVINNTSNTLLNNSLVNYNLELNISDLSDTGKQGLVSFDLATTDPRNVNLRENLKDSGDVLHVVYSVGLISKRDLVDRNTFLRAFLDLQNNLANNRNNGVNYVVTLSGGKTLNSPLDQNIPDPFPELSIAEDSSQINYLTATNNIVFTILR